MGYIHMSNLYLKFPTIEDEKKVLDFKNEFILSGQKMAGVSSLDEIDLYNVWLEKINNALSKTTCKNGRVPATQYLTYRKEDGKLVGMVQIRHELNDYLLLYGGHIGDCVRPTEQGKGYATQQIGLALEKCKEMNISKVLITCKKENIASARTIQKNNGVLENEVDKNGEINQRYWIDLTDRKNN